MRTNTGAPAPPRGSSSTVPERVAAYNPETGEQFRMGPLPPESTGSASHSRIYFPVREDIYSVLILFDREQVKGKSLLQLADYATMRGLAFTRETSGEVPAATILGLFDGEGPKPERLTSFDTAYLTSLYDSSRKAAHSTPGSSFGLASGVRALARRGPAVPASARRFI